ncbi:hypothetical protein GMOD_00009366 [Pyrenophora seminiperda CCB06]|uniref:F-box domain-containing protein n=1 Tax=Pyrenophora seminiperda CCB06 TaxID=1302712 RepID=A0A3M7MGJ0_9PLEO|nr:hypothetical protein GMOD_00009366 [Pyrenophora seminiperda CCB06]
MTTRRFTMAIRPFNRHRFTNKIWRMLDEEEETPPPPPPPPPPLSPQKGLNTLPEELLLHIVTNFLDRPSLLATCLTSKKFQRIASPVLYTHIVLDVPYCTQYHGITTRIFRFARTLLDRPDLARRVRSLSLTTEWVHKKKMSVRNERSEHMESILLSCWGNAIYKAVAVVKELAGTHACWATRSEDWIFGMKVGSGHAWAGLVLALLPRLEDLTIEVLAGRSEEWQEYEEESVWDEYRFELAVTERLFGWAAHGDKSCLDLATLPGLRNLRVLKFFGGFIAPQWFVLPNLCSIQVGRGCKLPAGKDWGIILQEDASGNAMKKSKIRHLGLGMSTFAVVDEEDDYHKLSPDTISRTRFPCLDTLTIQLTNIDCQSEDMDILDWKLRGNMDFFLSCMGPVKKALRHFFLPIGGDPTFLAWIEPVTSLAAFTKLKSLRIPQDLLLGENYGLCKDAPDIPDAEILFPKTLKLLTIQYPTAQIFDWLDIFDKSVDKGAFPAFQGVHLLCEGIRGDPCPAMCAEWEVWYERRRRPYEVWIYYMEDEEHPSWYNGTWSKDWDPYVIRVVKFLEDLHVEPDAKTSVV